MEQIDEYQKRTVKGDKMNDRPEGSRIKKTFMFSFFLFLLVILFPILTLISLCIDFSFITENSQTTFNIAVLGRSFIKTAIAIYGVIIAIPFVRQNNATIYSIKIYLFVALFSPWAAEIPFFLLSFYSKTPFLIIKEVWVNVTMSTVFFAIWFSYFSFSRQAQEYIEGL